ncbi:MAG: LysR substrate-binding domain-containing protein [Vibrio sp.]
MDKKQQQLTNMHTFSVAAKFLSFTKAAEELFITQGAVSQRIKALESQLGFSLFVRLTRKLELTQEGQRLLHAINQSFDVIFSEIEDIQFNELRGELYIGVAPTFGQSWLLPRLADFQQKYPNLNVKIRVKASRLDFQHEPVDIAIYYSNDEHSGFYHQRLFQESLTPICTPKYFEQHFDHSKPLAAQLQQATFIHSTESLEASEPSHEWNVWLKQQTQLDLHDLNVMHKSYIFNHSDMAAVAVKNHMGIGLGRKALIESYLKSGDLIAPFEQVESNKGYDLVCLNGQQHRPKNAAFIQWLETVIG